MGKLYRRLIIIVLLGFFINNSTAVTYGLSDIDVQQHMEELADLEVNEFKVRAEIHLDKPMDDAVVSIVQETGKLLGQVSQSGEYSYAVNCDENNLKLTFEPVYRRGNTCLIADLSGSGNLDYYYVGKMRETFEEILSQINMNSEYSLCIKSKILNNTMEEIEEIVLDYLKVNRAQNTEVIMINNGYSIMSTLGMKNNTVVLDNNIDFSCAIVKYSSGCYLLLGTPEITITY